MSEIKEKKSNNSVFGIFFRLVFYSVILFLLDAILMYYIGGDVNALLHIISIDIAIGLIFALILSITSGVTKKILFIVINLTVILYAILLFAEIYFKLSFEAFYPLKTIIFNYKDALAEYHSDIKEIISSRILVFILLILIIILTLYAGKVLFFDEYKKTKNKLVYIVVVFLIIIASFVGAFTINNSSYDFSDAIINGGLKTAVLYEYSVQDDYSFDLTVETNINNETEEDFEKVVAEVVEEETEINKIDAQIVTETTTNSKKENEAPKINHIKNVRNAELNVLDIDFESIIKSETRKDYNNVNTFVMNRAPTNKNAYTGLFKGKNLIMICAEAFNSTIVNEDLFPTMYRLIHNGFKFNNFYQPKGGSTSSGEFTFMTGILPIYTDRSFVQSENNNMGFTISQKLKDEGYHTYSFHNGTSTFYSRDNTHGELMGFDRFMANDTGLSALTGKSYPNDLQLFESTFDLYANEKPFLAYYMTYSGHMPYTNFGSASRLSKVNEYYGDTKSLVVKTYIAKNLLLEEGLTSLINNLEANGMLNDTVICLVPDHYPYGLYNANAVTGEATNYVAELYNDPFIESHTMERDRTDLVLWSGCLENEYKDMAIEIDKYVSTIDITPTIFNLFDIPYDSRLYPGRDIFSDSEGIVIYQNGKYIAADETNQNAIGASDLALNHYSYAKNLVNYCTFFIKNDYYGYLTGDKGNAQKICYLTFDGGPSDTTLAILDILSNNDAKACFFVVGDGKLDYLPEISKRGNTVYPLADSSDYMSMYIDENTYINKIEHMREIIKAYTGKDSLLLRFPYGSGNSETIATNPGIMTRLASAIKQIGCKYADWNVESGDFDKDLAVDDIVNNVINGAKGNDIICIHFHDTVDNENTIMALPIIIEKLKNEGYKFKALNRHSTNFKQTIVN